MGYFMSFENQELRDEAYLIRNLEFWYCCNYSELKPMIERMAYRLWDESGRPEGGSLKFWTMAEKTLLSIARSGGAFGGDSTL